MEYHYTGKTSVASLRYRAIIYTKSWRPRYLHKVFRRTSNARKYAHKVIERYNKMFH